MAEPLKQPYLQRDEKRGDYQVWIVDGAYVRGHIDEEFTNFGGCPTAKRTPSPAAWNSGAATILMNCMMH